MAHPKRKTLAILVVLACTALPACTTLQSYTQLGCTQLGDLLGGGAKPGSGDIDTQLKTFLGTSMRVESTVNKAALAIVAAYASEEERAKLQTRFDEINKLTDPKEAGATFQAIHESSDAAIKKLAASDNLADLTSKMSIAKKRQLAKGVGNFMLGATQAKSLAPSGQALLKSAGTNPVNFCKLLPVKDALPRLVNAGTLAGNSLPQLIKALQGANVQVANISSSSREAPMDRLE